MECGHSVVVRMLVIRLQQQGMTSQMTALMLMLMLMLSWMAPSLKFYASVCACVCVCVLWSRLTFAALTGESVVVVPRGFVTAHDTQLLPLEPLHPRHVSARLAHGRHHGGLLAPLAFIADLQRSFPQLVDAWRRVPIVSIVLREEAVTGVVLSGGRGLHRRVLQAWVAAEG